MFSFPIWDDFFFCSGWFGHHFRVWEAWIGVPAWVVDLVLLSWELILFLLSLQHSTQAAKCLTEVWSLTMWRLACKLWGMSLTTLEINMISNARNVKILWTRKTRWLSNLFPFINVWLDGSDLNMTGLSLVAVWVLVSCWLYYVCLSRAEHSHIYIYNIAEWLLLLSQKHTHTAAVVEYWVVLAL